ncbi:hypothetical protein J5069_03025 [Candidatus Symbiopectobacterium sp. NZEC127]|uniref:LPD38 domain-containing protein n=1 Tax=Candidatus Symbiopectobacterium sp. NZEC127 TaxID=2820472 RepID=UPI0022265B68|nr:LPD38 domain-containing protein [Candidatus Symbiopectobacterium sp. NZEC127]MCW2484864.1 hypothetical protein [Candidatus Symbiopectobacterium sp. NZEC127]
MAYDPQQQRPEQQITNDNRQGLNIQQPGEVPDFDRQFFAPENWNKAPVEAKATWGDRGKALIAAPFEFVRGLAQLPVGLAHGAENYANENVDTPETQQRLGLSDETMANMRKIRGSITGGADLTFGSVEKITGSAVDTIKDSMTEGGKKAASQKFLETEYDKDGDFAGFRAGNGLFNVDTWVMNAAPSLAQMFTAAGVAKIGAKGVQSMIEQGTFNRLRKTMSEDAARVAAKRTGEAARERAQKYGFIAGMSGSAQGQGGIDMREEINALSFNELMNSTSFQKAFADIDTDPNNANLNDTQKLTMARSQVAELAAASVTSDPRLLAINIAASLLGDHTLLTLLVKKSAARGITSGIFTGATAEGATEFAQGAGQRYAQNEQLIDTAGQKIDPMKDVLEVGANNAVAGAGMGGAFGVVGGMRGRNSDNTPTEPNQKVETTEGQFSPDQQQATQVDVPEWQTTGQPSTEGNGPSIPIVKLGDDSPPTGYTGEWRDGGPVISVTQGADDSPLNPENAAGIPASQLDDFRDTPAYLRQDPRIQGFADDSEVQQALADSQPAPTADELIRQQIDNGEQGYSPQELETLAQAEQIIAARRPRLPAPGQTSVIAMPGDLHAPLSDETQAGVGPQFDAGQQVRGQQFIPAEGSQQSMNEVGRASQTYDGEAVPTHAIEDKNIIFAGAPTIDEGQTVQPPQFSGGEMRTQQQSRESHNTVAENQDLAGLTDQRHRVAGVPVDATTEAYARGEPVGALKFYQRDRPFSNERVSKHSKWGKMPGAKVEKVEGGYGVRLPASETPQSKITDFGEELHGAAKHRWGQFSQAMDTAFNRDEVSAQPLSKVFPHPEYSKMAEAGIGKDVLASLAVLRAHIPNKPTNAHRAANWADNVLNMKSLANSIINGDMKMDDFKNHMRARAHLSRVADTIDLVSQFAPDQMKEAAKYRIGSGHYTVYNGKPYPNGKTVYELRTIGNKPIRDMYAESVEALLPKAKVYIEQQIGAAQENGSGKQSKIEVFRRRTDGQVFLGYKGSTQVLPLKAGFKDSAEARDYLKNNRAELEAKLEKLRKISREEQRGTENQKRSGPARRQTDVTPDQFDDTFGFRGVQFGNYVEDARRQADLNDAFDALTDMAEVLGVPEKALSLNGELGLAFGARGRGGARSFSAHYEPGQVVINLTKGSGAGSLAHEWFHALDNYFGQADQHGYDNKGTGDNFITRSQRRDRVFQNGKMVPATHPVRQEVYRAFKDTLQAINNSGMVERAQTLDSTRSKPYWSTVVELSARAFERYVQDKTQSKGISNDYLVNVRKSNEHADPQTYAYPTEAELSGGIRAAFDNLFRTLKTKPTEKGIAFYSRASAPKNGGVVVSGADIGDGNIIHDGSFSKDGSKPATGMLRDRVQLAADGFVSNLNGAAKIKVKAVQTQAEAAAMMPNGIPAEFGIVHAIYQPELSRVIVIADNIANPRELRAKLRHEVIAHHGLASVIGDVEYDRIMRVLHQTRNSQNKTIQEVWRQVERSYGNESLEEQANEFLAHMAERAEPGGLGVAWDRFISMLTAALRRVGIISPHTDVTPAEIRSILHTITGRFKKTAMYANEQPGTREFEDTFSRTDALYSAKALSDPFKPDSYDAKQFAQEVEQIARMDKAPRHQIRLGDTPVVYRALRARNLELIMPASVVHKAIDPRVRNHLVKLEDVKRLPELIADPIAVMKSATEKDALVSLVAAHDANGSPVIVAIHLNGKGAGFAEINKIASVYGKDSQSALQRQLNSDLLYLNKEKATQWLHAAGLQLPGANTLNGSGQNILSSADIRKNKALYSRAGNPAMDAETSRKMGFNVEKGWFDKPRDFWQMATDKDKTALKQWWHDTSRKLNTRTFDGLAPLKYAEDTAGGFDATASGYTAARMAAGAGAVSGVVWEHGLVRYNKKEGVTERISGTGKADSLMGIFDALGSQRENFLKWIAGHRSERLMAEGRENNFTADEIAYIKMLNRGNETLFTDQKRKYDAFIKSILDLQQDMGLIDPESRATWEDAWYLPYFREAENGETHGPWTTRGVANQSSTVRKLKGSELTIKDPIENLFNYVAKSVDASMKNEAMRRSVVNLADTGALEVIENPNKMDYGRIGKNVVKVYIDGQEQLVQVNDPDLFRAFTMIDMERSNSLFMRAARQAKRVLTIGTTAMPDFILRNFMRDSLHSWAINKDGFRAGISSWQGLKKALVVDDTLVDMMAAGATFGGGYLNVYDPAGSAANIRKVLRRKGYSDSQMREFESTLVRSSKDVLEKLETGWEKYRQVSEGAENANRVATYDAALKSGKSKAQAAFEARDLMDFSMMGSSKLIIGLTDVVPFLNARLQGMNKLGRAIKEDPREVLKRGGYIAGVSLALLALNWDDERYEELPDWDKDAYWHFWAGDQHIRFPKPFEIGLMFGTMPERFVRMLGGEDTPGKFGKMVARNFFETMAFNPIPQVVKPIAEAYVNYDFFRGGPIENMADSNLIAEARYNDQTSLLMRGIGQATGLSPKMLDHIVQGYTGTLGAYVLGAGNIVARQFTDAGETPALRLDELPVIKSFLRGADPAKSTQFADDFYRMMSQANQINRTINAYREQGRSDDAHSLQEDHRGLLSKRQALTRTQKAIRQLNDRIEMVRIDRTLNAQEKRERIDRMMGQRNKLYQQAVERVHSYFD